MQTKKEIVITSKKEVVVSQKKKTKTKKEKKPKKYFFKKLFLGIGKEFERVTWTSKRDLLHSFIIVIVIVLFFALIYTGITIAIVS